MQAADVHVSDSDGDEEAVILLTIYKTISEIKSYSCFLVDKKVWRVLKIWDKNNGN